MGIFFDEIAEFTREIWDRVVGRRKAKETRASYVDRPIRPWRITDQDVVDLLKSNGFRCRPMSSDNSWYLTDCPIQFNEYYALHDGTIIESRDTLLIVCARKQ